MPGWFQGDVQATVPDSPAQVLEQAQTVLSQGKRLHDQGEFTGALATFRQLQSMSLCVEDEELQKRIHDAAAAGLGHSYLKLADFTMVDGKRLFNQVPIGDFKASLETFKRLQQIALEVKTSVNNEPLTNRIKRAAEGGLGNSYLELSDYAVREGNRLQEQAAGGQSKAAFELFKSLKLMAHEVMVLVLAESKVNRILCKLMPGLEVIYASLEQHDVTCSGETRRSSTSSTFVTEVPEDDVPLVISGDILSGLAKYSRAIEYHVGALTLSRAIGVDGVQLGNVYDNLRQFCQALELEQIGKPTGSESYPLPNTSVTAEAVAGDLETVRIPLVSMIHFASKQWAEQECVPFVMHGQLPLSQVRVTNLSEELTAILAKCKLKSKLLTAAVEWCNANKVQNIGSIAGVDAALKLCTASSFEKMATVAVTNQAASMVVALQLKSNSSKKLLKEFQYANEHND